MWLLRVSFANSEHYIVTPDKDTAVAVCGALRTCGVTVKDPVMVVPFYDATSGCKFVLVDGRALYLHPRPYGWEAKDTLP